jgi:hypothetical protein
MPIRRPARRWFIPARGYGSKLIKTEGRPVLRWAGGERDDRRSFERKLGSVLVAHEWVCLKADALGQEDPAYLTARNLEARACAAAVSA